MSSFHVQDQFLLSYENGTIDDNRISALQEEFMSKNLDFSYEEHNKVLLEEMNNNATFLARYNLKRLSPYKILSLKLKRKPTCRQEPEAFYNF